LKLPPIKANSTMTSNMSEMVKPRSMAKTNEGQFFNQRRPPSSHSNALSEIEMNNDAGSSVSAYQGGGGVRRNNLVADTSA
jgi:hypothetical protein